MSMARRIALTVPLSLVLLLASGSAKLRPDGTDPSFVREKQPIAISEQAQEFLASKQVDGKVKVWVFFTDKTVYNDSDFRQAAQLVEPTISERAKARRARHGIEGVRFADLPVSALYTRRLAELGAKILSTSRWLNAAAVEIDFGRLAQIAPLPYVQRIQPVAQYTRPLPEVTAQPEDEPMYRQPADVHALSYGTSFGQLNQINVPTCHDAGYNGEGVLIAVFDTGFRTGHVSFANAIAQGRLIAQYDFVFGDSVVDNQPEDWSSAWSHGTSTWSTCGGENSGVHYGPAYKASFILCKTEDVRQEVIQEEYDWVAAAEWVETLGADIITSSLGYSDWYVQANYNGDYCVTTVAADNAAEAGVLVVNSIGNSGPGATTMGAPADADSIIAVGAVNSTGTIASFSSRGPTADGRIKPEVCAQGVSCYVASSSSTTAYGFASGTSFSCPLTAGAAAIVWQANPTWTNMQVREALMLTANNALLPNNTYGWGIINTWAALNYSYGPSYVAGDADGSGDISVSDAVYLITFIFAGGPAPNPMEAADTDCNGAVTISDAVFLINHIFAGGPAPDYCT